MPKTNSGCVTNTATLIPNRIPIHTPSLTDHIKSTSDQLIHIMLHKKTPLGPYLKPTTKEHLLTLARLLHQDKIPAMLLTPLPSSPIKAPISEDDLKTTTSEGVIKDTPSQLTTNTTPSPTTDGVSTDTSPSQYSTSESEAPRSITPTKDYDNINTSKFTATTHNTTTSKQTTTSANNQDYHRHMPLHLQKFTFYASSPKNYKYNYGTSFRPKAAKYILEQYIVAQNKAMHIYSLVGRKISIDSKLREKPEICGQSTSNGLGRLAQVITDVHCNDAMEFILKSKVPSHKKVTYANMVCDVRPKKMIYTVHG